MLKIPTVKRLLKKSFKGTGITVGKTTDGWFYIGTMAWNLCMDFKDAPKEIKAAVMEIAGELPDSGQAFTAWKDTANQYALEDERCVIPTYYGENIEDNKSNEMDIIFTKDDARFRLMRAGDTAHIIKEEYLDMLNPDVDYEGPFMPDPGRPSFVWHTDLTYLEVLPYVFRKSNDEEPRSMLRDEIDAVAAAFGMKLYEK